MPTGPKPASIPAGDEESASSGDARGPGLIPILTDHAELDYRRSVEIAPLVIDTRHATQGIPAPEERVIAL